MNSKTYFPLASISVSGYAVSNKHLNRYTLHYRLVMPIIRSGTNRYEVEIETDLPGHCDLEWEATFNGPISRIVVFGLAS